MPKHNIWRSQRAKCEGYRDLEWPHFYPENCPPMEAQPASDKVYRLVRSDPAQEKDFKALFEENPQRFKSEPDPKICIGCGLSVHTDLQDSERLRKRVRKFKNRQIAEGELNPTFGMIQHTPSSNFKSHHTWWIPIESEPWIIFKVISEHNSE